MEKAKTSGCHLKLELNPPLSSLKLRVTNWPNKVPVEFPSSLSSLSSVQGSKTEQTGHVIGTAKFPSKEVCLQRSIVSRVYPPNKMLRFSTSFEIPEAGNTSQTFIICVYLSFSFKMSTVQARYNRSSTL
uniref:Uncharacterized protein n=1 Tax=Opuntia streptacantha TaxID=393608 RepID=A0A7C8ZUI7_OPUST